MLRDHFDAFVLTGDAERPAVPTWKLEVPGTVAAALPALDVDAVLDECLAPYMRASAAFRSARDPEHNGPGSQETWHPGRFRFRVAPALCAVCSRA